MHHEGGLEAALAVNRIDEHRVAAGCQFHRARIEADRGGERLNHLAANRTGLAHLLDKDRDSSRRRDRIFDTNLLRDQGRDTGRVAGRGQCTVDH